MTIPAATPGPVRLGLDGSASPSSYAARGAVTASVSPRMREARSICCGRFAAALATLNPAFPFVFLPSIGLLSLPRFRPALPSALAG